MNLRMGWVQKRTGRLYTAMRDGIALVRRSIPDGTLYFLYCLHSVDVHTHNVPRRHCDFTYFHYLGLADTEVKKI